MHPSSPNSANETLVSRRNWLVLAASAGASIASQTQAADSDKKPALSLELAAGARVYNIRDYGAKGDGKTVDTTAVQDAVDTCARERGGTVLVPAGDFVIGTVELKSNVRLYLSPQGRLLGTADIKHYSPGKGVPTSNGNVVLLYAASAENITVEGTGTVDGQGAKFYTGRGDNTGPGQKREEGYVDRPHLIIFYRCKNLRVRDTFFTASAYHCMRILECRNVQLEAVRIHNRVNKNNDGFHIVSSEFVHIANCDVACQDDACALFGSNKFVTVTNCTFSTRWSIFRFGGGEAENIVVSNCVIYETYGCAIKIRIGGGSRIENVLFDNIIMRDVTGPISIGLDSTSHRASASGEARAKGVVRNLMFRGIRATVVAEGKTHADLPFPSSFRPGETRTCIVLNGVGEDFLQDITLSDVHITFEGGGTAEEAARLKVPKMAGEYFELGTLPAYGLYARNVRGLTLKNVRFETTKPDLRPALLCDNVADLAATTFSAHGN
ncbi:MAG TPA: glycosyl hydrolase family 28 protein, partial [Candidatus Dormibacteraeota bacterium]|nr:glycosyl hydrolase family 28 protein [Candidatus Dormibacteraeota bacterium]